MKQLSTLTCARCFSVRMSSSRSSEHSFQSESFICLSSVCHLAALPPVTNDLDAFKTVTRSLVMNNVIIIIFVLLRMRAGKSPNGNVVKIEYFFVNVMISS